uniref:U4-Hypotoxin-Hsp1a_1 n=1 Tax=Hypochilus sp. SGP-2016 TaxID=1905178 RepID=A0A482ZAK0_9ARAC
MRSAMLVVALMLLTTFYSAEGCVKDNYKCDPANDQCGGCSTCSKALFSSNYFCQFSWGKLASNSCKSECR